MERLIIGFVMTLIAVLVVMPSLIKYLHKIKFGQSMREEGPKSHAHKQGTPTMGGIVFVLVPVLLFLVLDFKAAMQLDMIIVLLAYVGYAGIGLLDDYIIVVRKNNEGLKPKAKFGLQALLAVILFALYTQVGTTSLYLPFFGIDLELGLLFFFFIFIMFTAESNATNLTDGLDGLCATTSIIAIVPFVAFSLLQGNMSLALLLVMVIAGLVGYLQFNKYPAKIFMGDTGSLAIGALLAASAMILKQEIALLVIGGIFLVETLSVVLQVGYFKASKGKRLFRMAPLHHHFELGGMKEVHIVRNFALVGIVLAIIGFWIGIH
ncbi:MAG: phospho-N-acetylmuramoyl-pentapeptide-transferase [Erysipelotrichaceae bacterium]